MQMRINMALCRLAFPPGEVPVTSHHHHAARRVPLRDAAAQQQLGQLGQQ